MEKRYLLFFALTFLAIFGYAQLTMLLAPPPQEPVAQQEVDDGAELAAGGEQAEKVADDLAGTPAGDTVTATTAVDSEGDDSDSDGKSPVATPEPLEYVVLGSADPEDPYGLLVVVSNRGASLAQIEINNAKYPDLGTVENRQRFGHIISGYLGPEIVSDVEGRSGVRLDVVGPGTPAAKAKLVSGEAQPGLQAGDLILAIDEQEVIDKESYRDAMGHTQPDTVIRVTVERDVDGAATELAFDVELERPRLKIVHVEDGNWSQTQDEEMQHGESTGVASFHLELEKLGSAAIKTGKPKIDALPSLRHSNWRITQRPQTRGGEQIVEFTMDLNTGQLAEIGETGALRVVRRYRLAPIEEPSSSEKASFTRGYHLKMELEFHNLSDQPRDLAYRLDGPTGLPTEGWWYLYKVHPQMWHRAGARDVIWRTSQGHKLIGCTDVSKHAQKNRQNPFTQMNESSPADFEYAGVDTQYFAAVLTPDPDEQSRPLKLSAAIAMPVGEIEKKKLNLTNVSFRLISRATTIQPQETLKQNFMIFAGPKDPQVLAGYGLEDIIVYGWFKVVAQLMGSILHGFYWLTTFGGAISGSYALSIVLLTVLVRGCMFPLGRKQAQMAAKMQELAPEMKKIAEQYKNDMEKKAKAQQDLFKKHHYNPLSGCLPMFFQLPIFIGLYRALSVDIELRGASMVPGLPWCENLAAPDRLFFWGDLLPTALGAPNGFLGPYFNVLPLVTIAFFIVHQKLFTPPPTDDQTRMQHQMMKFMMVFMGFIFFKVAAGLCIYIISSSAWGVAERLLLPKSQPKSSDGGSPAGEIRPSKGSSSNGSAKATSSKKKKKAKGRR
ncbi:MAG: YidC/Oxa1 family insertase periplasmic-domain containing protein [Pirellulaceae bacterium]|nr:YidC/Oxa1 family insertase periplasmic-domain containing protein [Pirellulaceae bacterium]